MKTRITFCFLLVTLISFAQTHFKSEIDFGSGTVFSTFMDVNIAKGQFSITSPKDADVRIMGGKARLGRLLGKSQKKGIIVTIAGQQKADSLFGETKIPMFGKLKFRGIVKNNTLSGEFLNEKGVSIGSLSGVNSAEDRIDYSRLYPLIINTVQDNIYSKDALKTREWESFTKKIEKLCHTAHDDIELFLGFNILAQKLPFTHLSVFITQDVPEADETPSVQKTVVFEEKNPATAYLSIKNFLSSKAELATLLPKIVANKNYKNLIVDLRNNPGGGLDAAFEFAKYITDADMEVGYFVTNKLHYSGYDPELFKTLPVLQPKSTKDFTNDLKTLPGVKLIFKKPANPVFTGTLYVLTNGQTASTCEPIVYALKNSKKAVIIGQTTAGAMMAASGFDISGKYIVMVPIADFYTHDGIRLDKLGVDPDIETPSEEALQKALELITNDKIN